MKIFLFFLNLVYWKKKFPFANFTKWKKKINKHHKEHIIPGKLPQIDRRTTRLRRTRFSAEEKKTPRLENDFPDFSQHPPPIPPRTHTLTKIGASAWNNGWTGIMLAFIIGQLCVRSFFVLWVRFVLHVYVRNIYILLYFIGLCIFRVCAMVVFGRIEANNGWGRSSVVFWCWKIFWSIFRYENV